MLRVEIHCKDQSVPIIRSEARNAYIKGSLYCVMLSNGDVEKYPIANIFRIKEIDQNA